MLYYRVKRTYDGRQTRSGKTLVANELLTKREFEKLNIVSDCVVPVEISQRNVYMSFGVRFQNGTNHNSFL